MKHITKHIFVTGGVTSSLGKGLNCAAIGLLLESRGLRIALQKFDPYINVDPGTMNPYQHGEVYVTEDGAETDLDLGHYERFTNARITRNSNFTTGSIYSTVIERERKGKYLGNTVQVIPHITDHIKECIRTIAGDDVDVAISEIGGTVGDIESLPFLEAIRQFAQDVGRENVLYIHLTLVPYLKAAGEIKTKPTQHSVGKLREIGIQPDILICRTEQKLTAETKDKIALFCNVERQAVIEELDVKPYIYEIPLLLLEQGLDKLISEKLNLHTSTEDLSDWLNMIKITHNPKASVEIAVVGKYIRLQSAYESIYEALIHGGIANKARVRVKRVEAEELEGRKHPEEIDEVFENVDGILVPGGFGKRGILGKMKAIEYARKNDVPFLGICLGMQCAAIEFARNVCGLEDADSTEFVPNTAHPVICLLEEQRGMTQYGGTMRLGAQDCRLARGTFAFDAYQKECIRERHRHRYEFNNEYRKVFEEHGIRFSGINPQKDLVEIMEIASHPWFVAVQFHPEFKSKPTQAHPLFREFIGAAIRFAQQQKQA